MHPSTELFSYLLTQLATVVKYTGLTPEDNTPPPTEKERNEVAENLNKKEKALKIAATDQKDNARIITQLDKTVTGLTAIYAPMQKENAELQALLEDRSKKVIRDEAQEKEVAELAKRVAAIQEETTKMKATIDRLQAIQEETTKGAQDRKIETNRLRREVKSALDTYFKVADPKMIAERYNVPMDSNFSFNIIPDFIRRTKDDKPRDNQLKYGLGAEHTWDEHYWGITTDGVYSIHLKSIGQHEQVTTRVMYDQATELLAREASAIKAPVARLGITVNTGDREKHPEVFEHILGHEVEAFRPTVINNSTSSWYDMHDAEDFKKRRDFFTKDENTTTFKMDNGTVTYGLPDVAQPIIGNAAGNREWDDEPDPTYVKNFHPYHINIGASETPAKTDTNLRDDNAPDHIESYSSQNSAVHAIIKRPRWNKDGTPISVQYINPDYREIVEANLWKLTGAEKTPTQEELDDEKKYPPEKVLALKKDLAVFLDMILSSQRTDEKGINSNLKGTSFSAPTANGVILAASILYPDASKAELIDAFCSSCKPITRRQMPDKSNILEKFPVEIKNDVTYLVDTQKGYMYSPMAGFGEFNIRDDATAQDPDSWLKMRDRLETMKQERIKLTANGKRKTTVEVGEGTFTRETVIDGQPEHVTVELTKGREITTPEMQKQAQHQQDRVMEAFKTLERNNDASIVIDSSYPIHKLITERKYDEAVAALKTDSGILLSETDPYYKEVLAVVKDAKKHEEHSYGFEVFPSQDSCCLMTALRLKFKDKDHYNHYAVLEGPDGTQIPLRLSASKEGVVVTSTPGFMRKPTQGTWKLHTRGALDSEKTQLTISGTERKAELGILDVRETVLPKIEKKEARYAALAEKNIMKPIANPHAYLRDLHDPKIETPVEEKKKQTESDIPSSRQEFQLEIERFIEESQLRKKGFIPDGKLKKVSMFNPASQQPQSDIAQTSNVPMGNLTTQLGNILANANVIFDNQTTTQTRLPDNLTGALKMDKSLKHVG